MLDWSQHFNMFESQMIEVCYICCMHLKAEFEQGSACIAAVHVVEAYPGSV